MKTKKHLLIVLSLLLICKAIMHSQDMYVDINEYNIAYGWITEYNLYPVQDYGYVWNTSSLKLWEVDTTKVEYEKYITINGKGSDDDSWSTGLIGVAAWREDLEDPIWGINLPFQGWTPSSTHFWNADYGDDVKTPITLSSSINNAFHKANMYISNGKNISTPYYSDKGWWGGLKVGIQTNGGPIFERWTILGLFEYRFARIMSIPIDYQIWTWRRVSDDGKKHFSTLWTVGIGLKMRISFNRFNFYLQGSIATGLGMSPITLFYATGTEYKLNKKFGLVIDLRKNWFPEDKHFASIGINYFLNIK